MTSGIKFREMKNKIVLITGATSGIGRVTAFELAQKGASLILVYRNEGKGLKVIEEIRAKTPDVLVYGFVCDFESRASINKLILDVKASFPKIDVLINNAGTWQTSLSLTTDGVEKMFMVNFLAPYMLMKGLHEPLKAAGNARIVNVSSMAHRYGELQPADPELLKSFRHIKAYSNSKLLLLLVGLHFADKYKRDGITVNSLHPGVVNTALFDKFPSFMKWMTKAITITVEQGAKTSIYLASAPEVASISGQYFAKCKPARMHKAASDIEAIELAVKWAEDYCSEFC